MGGGVVTQATRLAGFERTKVHAVWAAAHERLRHLGQVVVAGGAVRDELRGVTPKDYDVFVLGLHPESPVQAVDATKVSLLVEARDEIKRALLTLPYATEVGPEPWRTTPEHPYQVVTVEALLPIPGNPRVTVQGVCSEHYDVEGLLYGFDWNVCRYAYDGDRVWQPEAHVTEVVGPGLPLRLDGAEPPYPLSTLRRGFRFSERFGMVLPPDVLTHLLGAAYREVRAEAAQRQMVAEITKFLQRSTGDGGAE